MTMLLRVLRLAAGWSLLAVLVAFLVAVVMVELNDRIRKKCQRHYSIDQCVVIEECQRAGRTWDQCPGQLIQPPGPVFWSAR